MTDLLAEIFSSKVRAAVLAFLLPRPHLGFSLTDLSRQLDLPISSLQHECYKLERIELLFARRAGNARLYRVDPRCPVLAPLTALVTASIGAEASLRGAVDGMDTIELAFLAGAPDGAPPGLRFVVVGDLALEELNAMTGRAEMALALPANSLEVAFFQPDDWRTRIAQQNPYVWELLTAPRTMVLDASTQAGVTA